MVVSYREAINAHPRHLLGKTASHYERVARAYRQRGMSKEARLFRSVAREMVTVAENLAHLIGSRSKV